MTRVACLQLDMSAPIEGSARVEEVCDRIAAMREVDLVVLPELWPGGYFNFDRYDELAEPLAGPTTGCLADAARACGAHVAGGSFLERGPGGELHNTAVLFGPDGERIESYRKVHVFGYGSKEAELISAGKRPAVSETPHGVVGLSLCYDLRFPELYRAEVDSGAQVLIVPAAWPLARVATWSLLLRARAIENQAFVIGCNGAGVDHGIEVGGHSAVIGPDGEPLAEAGAEASTLLAEFTASTAEEARASFPALADRRLATTFAPRSEAQAA
jgi:predicted amidohydrolase